MERKKRSTGGPLTGQSGTDESSNRIASFAAEIVASKVFDWAITGVILLQALTLAVEATPALLPNDKEGKLVVTTAFGFIQNLVIGVFIAEAALRLIALYPKSQRYFKDPWNCFDFTIIRTLLPAYNWSIFDHSKASQTNKDIKTGNKIH